MGRGDGSLFGDVVGVAIRFCDSLILYGCVWCLTVTSVGVIYRAIPPSHTLSHSTEHYKDVVVR